MEPGILETSMPEQRFSYGERIRHRLRPEWGVGNVTKVAEVTENGVACQRLSIRFPNAGVKTLSTAHAPLERVETVMEGDASFAIERAEGGSRLEHWATLPDSDWLAPVAQRKIAEVMVAIPEVARDPFRSLDQRLRCTLDLYRFQREGAGLIDWAIAQTGLADPMSRFNRHELEQYFDRWSVERDAHLGRLLQEAREHREDVSALLRSAPASASRALRRYDARR